MSAVILFSLLSQIDHGFGFYLTNLWWCVCVCVSWRVPMCVCTVS